MNSFGGRRRQAASSDKTKLTFSFKRMQFRNPLLSVFSNLRGSFEYPAVLESATGDADRLAEFSIIVFDPFKVLTARNGSITIEDRRCGDINSFEEKIDPLKVVQQIVESTPTEELKQRFVGGAVGYISYDAIRFWEKKLESLGEKSKGLQFPDMKFGFYEEGILYNHKSNKVHYFFSNRVKDRSGEIMEISNGDVPDQLQSANRLISSKLISNVKKEKFEDSVRRAKEYIRDGDIFQVVLSKRNKFTIESNGDLLQFYSRLRKLNPSPYMYFLDMGETKIVGSSPEMLVRVDGSTVETFPIAGTWPISKNKVENRKLSKAFLSDPKERAEHVMLVDLGRNDVGKVAKFGSISVPQFMEVHQYSHVQHLVSHVTGKLQGGLNSFDAIRALFPAGTVSGAPKVRAMEIIESLETESRGPYAGTVGYFSFNGNMDSAITIRTLVVLGNEASIQTGAGIVADSDPETEWHETDRKAAALLRALEPSTEEQRLEETARN